MLLMSTMCPNPTGVSQYLECCIFKKLEKTTFEGRYVARWTLLTYSKQQRVLLEKLITSELVKKFPAFYGIPRFIAAFTSARHLPLSWTSSIQSLTSYPTSWRSTLILSSHLCLGLPSALFPSAFPTKTLYTPLLSLKHSTRPPHSSWFDHTNSIGWGVQNSSLCSFLHSRWTFSYVISYLQPQP